MRYAIESVYAAILSEGKGVIDCVRAKNQVYCKLSDCPSALIL